MYIDAATAIVSADKLRDYLLSPVHPIGRYKSKYFQSFGYTQQQWQILERDLRALLINDAKPSGANEFGQKYAVQGNLLGPNGRSAEIVSIWIILASETLARFVTAYPEE